MTARATLDGTLDTRLAYVVTSTYASHTTIQESRMMLKDERNQKMLDWTTRVRLARMQAQKILAQYPDGTPQERSQSVYAELRLAGVDTLLASRVSHEVR
jgi:hypothetical protein